MARLGSVVGGILKELAQARAIADRHSRDLVSEYERDPVLSTFSVPRVTLGEITLTLRFAVNDLEEEPSIAKDYTHLAAEWQRHASKVLVEKSVERLSVTPELRTRAVGGFKAKVIASEAMVEAITKSPKRAAQLTTDALLEQWNGLPLEVRQALGGKTEFRRALLATAEAELTTLLLRENRLDDLRQVLASRLDIGIRTAELPENPQRIHEMTLTLRGEDLEMVMSGQEK